MTYHVGRQGVLQLVLSGGRKTTITEQFVQPPYHIQRAIHCDDTIYDMAHLYMMSSSGGILGKDSHTIQITLKGKARARLTTQGATRIYDTQGMVATQSVSITLEQDSYLEFLPDITIPYKNSRYVQSVDIVCHPSATIIYTDILSSGRRAFGEMFEYSSFKSTVSAKSDTDAWRLYDASQIEPTQNSVSEYGIMGTYDIVSTIYILAPASIIPKVYSDINDTMLHHKDISCGASITHSKDGIIVRMLANKTEDILHMMYSVVRVVRHHAVSPVV